MNAKKIFFFVMLLAGFWAWVKPGMAQQPLKGQLRVADSTFIQMVKTTDGSSNVGWITQIDSLNIQLETAVTTISIPIAKITAIKEIPAESIKDGEYWFPNTTRLFFGPTAHMLKSGEGYFSDTRFFSPGGGGSEQFYNPGRGDVAVSWSRPGPPDILLYAQSRNAGQQKVSSGRRGLDHQYTGFRPGCLDGGRALRGRHLRRTRPQFYHRAGIRFCGR